MKGILRQRRYHIRRDWNEWLLPTWQVGLALVALLDILSCWSIMANAWKDNNGDDEEPLPTTPAESFEECVSTSNDDTCTIAMNERQPEASGMLLPMVYFVSSLPLYIGRNLGPIFCGLCIINAVVRARRAQQLAYENAALDVFESKLASLCSTARSSFLGHDAGEHQRLITKDIDHELAHKTLRIWGPVVAQLTLWFILIPWTTCFFWTRYSEILFYYYPYEPAVHGDSALATIWLTRTVSNIKYAFKALETQAWTLFWKRMRKKALKSPIKLYHRIRQVFRWIRFIRYAGPLLRMLDKALHHTRDLIRTWKQNRAAKHTKWIKIQDKFNLQKEIERIASNERLNRAVRGLKSQVFKRVPSHYQNLLQKSVGDTLAAEKRQHAKIKRKVEDLTSNVENSWGNISEVYDQLVDLTQEVTSSVRKEVLNSHLIPPNTKFSVAWRVIVSGSLLVELLRLWASWKAHGDFTVSLAELLKQWFVTCDATAAPSNSIHQRLNGKPFPDKVRELLVASGRLFKFGKHKIVVDTPCLDISYTATLAQQLGLVAGYAIDVVNFLDIFVWFNTGELDLDGNVVPKPFFSRCILPGTLVQVFDHPTLPTVLPKLFLRLLGVSEAVGFARVVRWGLVLEPAFNLLVFESLKSYLLSPAVEDDDTVYGSYSVGYNLDALNSNGSLKGFLGNNNSGHSATSKRASKSALSQKDSMIFRQSFVY